MPKKFKALLILVIFGALNASSAQAGFFSTRYGDFKELIETGKVEEATALYAKEKIYFSELKDDKRKFVDDVLAQRDLRYGTKLGEASLSLMLAEAETSQMVRWIQFKKGFEQAQDAITSVEMLSAPGPLMTSGLASLKASVEQKKQTLQLEAPQALLEYGLFTDPAFPTQYPISVQWSNTPQFTQRVEEQLSKASLQQLMNVKKTYGDTLIKALGLTTKLNEFYVTGRLREAGARSYLAKQLLRQRLAKEGWGQSNSSAGVIIAAWPAPKSEVSSYQVTPPTSVGYMALNAANTPNDVIKSFAASKRDLIVFVRTSQIRGERNESNVRQINSQYQTGTRRVANPAYANARNALTRARQSLANVQLAVANASTSSNSTLGILAAVVSGVSQAAAENDVSDAQRTLENTPSYIDEAVFAAYTYGARTITVKQSVITHYAVYDMSTGQTTTGSLDRNHNKTFYVVDSVRTDDPNYDTIFKSAKTEKNVEAWVNSAFLDKYDAICDSILVDYKAKNLGI